MINTYIAIFSRDNTFKGSNTRIGYVVDVDTELVGSCGCYSYTTKLECGPFLYMWYLDKWPYI